MIATSCSRSVLRKSAGLDRQSDWSQPSPAPRQTARQGAEAKRRAATLHEQIIEFIPNARFATCLPEEMLSPEVAQALRDAVLPGAVKKKTAFELGTPLARACELPLLTPAQERGLFERLNYLKFRATQLLEWLPIDAPLLADVEEIEHCLAEAQEVRNRIVGANVRLVISIVKVYADLKNPFDELVSDGILTMMHAVEKFDYDRGFRFSTYATRALRRNLYRLLVQRQKDRQRFATSGEESLDVADEQHVSPISEQRWTELQGHLKRMLQELEPRERQIIRARFGMEQTGQVQTLQALAKTLGICKERVRQLEKRALDKLQKMVDSISLAEHLPEAS